VEERASETGRSGRGPRGGRWAVVGVVGVVVAIALVMAARRLEPRREAHASSAVAPSAPPSAIPSAAPPPLSVVVFGDSTANSLGWILRGTRRPGLTVELLGKDGCSMVYDACLGETWRAEVTRAKPDAVLVFPGGVYLHPWTTARGKTVFSCSKEWDAELERVLTLRLREVARAGPRVYGVTLPHSRRPWDGPKENGHVDCVNAVIRRAVANVPAAAVLDLGERVCPRGECPEREPDMAGAIRSDGIHYDMEGAQPIARWVLEELSSPTRRE
jgi:hypothetical protein